MRARQPIALRQHVYDILRHAPVRGELAADDRHHAVDFLLQDDVRAREVSGMVLFRLHEWPIAGVHAQDVVLGQLHVQHPIGMIEEIGDVLWRGFGVVQITLPGVGRADDGAGAPREHEQDASVVSLRNDDRRLPDADALPRYDEMYALAGLDGDLGLIARQPLHPLRKNAGGVHHVARGECKGRAGEHVADVSATEPLSAADEAHHLGVIRDHGSVLRGRAQHRHREAGIVRLRVGIEERFFQPHGIQRGRQRERRLGADASVTCDTVPPGHQVVHPQTHIKDQAQADAPRRSDGHADRALGTLVEGQQEDERLNQEGGVADQQPALDERLMDEAKIEQRQIANATMHQLGGLAAGSAREVGLFHQRDPIAARGCVQGYSGACDPTADHEHIELVLRQVAQICRSCGSAELLHRSSPPDMH